MNSHFNIPISFAQVDSTEIGSKEHGLHLWYKPDSDQIGHCREENTDCECDHFGSLSDSVSHGESLEEEIKIVIRSRL